MTVKNEREAPRAHYETVYLKIHKQGGTRAMSVGQLLPVDWEMVEVSGTFEDEENITINVRVVTKR